MEDRNQPYQVESMLGAARCYEALKQKPKALEIYEKALAQAPQSTMAEFIRWKVSELKGKRMNEPRNILSGNEAIARGAYESGVKVAAAYPGTPSTEILESLGTYPGPHVEWSPNEKVAWKRPWERPLAEPAPWR